MLNPIINIFTNNDDLTETQAMYEDLIIESIQCIGTEWYYLPRTMLAEDWLLREDVHSAFNSNYAIEGYLENLEAFKTYLMTRERGEFFLDVKGQLVISKKRFREVMNDVEARPYEGDLFYSPIYQTVFEVRKVIHNKPFHEVGQLPCYEILIDKWEYNHDILDTGIEEVDNIQHKYAYQMRFKYTSLVGDFEIGDRISQTIGSIMIDGTISYHDTVNRILSVSDITSSDPIQVSFSPSEPVYVDSGASMSISKIYTIDSSLTEQESVNVMPHDTTSQNQKIEVAEEDVIIPTTNNPYW